jgi:hypothetical protein
MACGLKLLVHGVWFRVYIIYGIRNIGYGLDFWCIALIPVKYIKNRNSAF